MKIISWNIWGVGYGGFKTLIKDLINIYNLDITILMETRVTSKRAQEIINKRTVPSSIEIFL